MLIKCDYCGKEFERPTNRVNESIKKWLETVLFR